MTPAPVHDDSCQWRSSTLHWAWSVQGEDFARRHACHGRSRTGNPQAAVVQM